MGIGYWVIELFMYLLKAIKQRLCAINISRIPFAIGIAKFAELSRIIH